MSSIRGNAAIVLDLLVTAANFYANDDDAMSIVDEAENSRSQHCTHEHAFGGNTVML